MRIIAATEYSPHSWGFIAQSEDGFHWWIPSTKTVVLNLVKIAGIQLMSSDEAKALNNNY